MSSIVTFQNGHELSTDIEIGASAFPTFVGDTASFLWELIAVPSGSNAVMFDDTTDHPRFEPDVYGTPYTVRFTDSFTNTYTASFTAQPPMDDLISDKAKYDGIVTYPPDVAAVNGRPTKYQGQNGDATHYGGAFEIASGAGGLGSLGLILSERAAGSVWATYQMIQLFANGGLNTEMALVGGSTGAFLFNGNSLQTLSLRSGNQLYLDAIHDVYVRTGAGFDVVIRAFDNKLGFFNATPVVQATRPGQLTDNTGGGVDGTLEDVTTLTLADPAKCNANFADLADKVNKLETIIKNLGLAA